VLQNLNREPDGRVITYIYEDEDGDLDENNPSQPLLQQNTRKRKCKLVQRFKKIFVKCQPSNDISLQEQNNNQQAIDQFENASIQEHYRPMEQTTFDPGDNVETAFPSDLTNLALYRPRTSVLHSQRGSSATEYENEDIQQRNKDNNENRDEH